MKSETPPFRRKRKLVKPKIQLQISGMFFGVVSLALFLQALLLAWSLAATANEMPVGGDYLMELILGTVTRTLVATLCLVLPLVVLVGVVSTFKIVGPVHHMEDHLRRVIRREPVGPCTIRKGDAFQELCDLINGATVETREAAGEEREGASRVA